MPELPVPRRRSAAFRRTSTTAVLVLSLLAGVGPAQAAEWKPKDPRRWSPGKLTVSQSVPGKDADSGAGPAATGDRAPKWRPTEVNWPAATDAEVNLAATAPAVRGSLFAASGASSSGQAGNAPVWLESPAAVVAPGAQRRSAGPKAGKAEVRLADRASAEKLGVNGLLLTVGAGEGTEAGAPVKVSVDVSRIAGAYGGDWISRARLVALPECALTTPDRAECRTQSPVVTAADPGRPGLLSTELAMPAGGPATAPAGSMRLSAASGGGAVVLAATAAPGGGAGNYGVSSLAPSGTWSAGGNTGGFSWSYPIDVPEGLGGSKPNVGLSYSSQAVDGRTAATNNQASWIGEGWDYTPGFVERRFKPCAKDGQTGSGEQCISGYNATISLNGRSSVLVKDDSTGTWRLEGDDASKVELLTGADNGDNNGEHWRVTTTDGTQYWFGAGRKPGTPTAPATNSAWTTPVYGNNAGEECNKAAFADSFCNQAWRWNLDFVVDAKGGVITHWYDTETNNYRRGLSAANPTGTLTSYVRGGTLNRITYGSKLSDPDTVKPTAQVLFGTAERCLPDAGFDCAPAKLTKADAAKWPDVPFDQNCAATGTCENYSATFWSTKRLTKITTQVLSGGSYLDVDSYDLTHEFPDPQDHTAPALWLASITHNGHDGAARLSTPPVTFTGQLKNNRVDSSGDNRPPLNRRRIVAITAETGQVTDVTYAEPDCAPGALPTAQDGNTKRCYPVYWNPDEKSPVDPTLDWFHKYVVSAVTERDPFGTSPDQLVRYEYVGDAAWHRDDDELTEDKRRTWNQFRGYEQVITRTGAAPDVVGKSASFYLRGMDGDVKADGSKRSVTFTDSTGATVKDGNPLAGSVRETQAFAGDGGALTVSSQSDPWLSPVTASHGRGGGLPPLTAQMLRGGSARDRALRSDGGWQTTSKTATFDPVYGMPVSVVDKADGLSDICTTTTYARNTAAWMVDRVAETVQIQGGCTTPTEANTLGRNRTFYDGQSHGVLTGPGLVTGTEELDRFEGGQPKYSTASTVGYDAYGRVVTSTDPAGATTTTAYTPAGPALPDTVKVTNAKGWATTSTFHPTRETAVKTVDHNGRTSEQTLDALGRVTATWQPGRAKATQSANTVLEYQLRNTGTSSVTTKTLRADQSYRVGIEILDAFGQTVQQQSDTANGSAGRLVSDTFYDTLGRPKKTNKAYGNTASGPTTTRFVADDNMVPGQSAVFYDGQGRPVTQTFSSKAIEQWRGTTSYPGVERTDTTPPKGDIATSVITDARGRSVERRQYKTGAPNGEYDATRYGYDTEGKLTQVNDAAGNAWTYGYDLHGRQTRAEDPDKGTTTTTYDAADRPVATTDARGVTTYVSYDILGRPTSRNLGAVDGTKLATYDYDTLLPGLPTASTSWVNGKGFRQEVTGYDTLYNPLGSKLTVPDGEGALSGTYTASTQYDAVTGLPRRTTLPAAGGLPSERLSVGRNVNGLPVSMGSDSVDYVNFTDYDEFGRVQRTTFGDVPKQVAFTSSYDPATDRVLQTQLQKQDAANPVDITDYTYTEAGDVTSVSTQQGAVRDTQCFTYDHLRRLTQAWTDTGTTTSKPGPSVPGIGGCTNAAPQTGKIGGPAPYRQSFSYDVTGNRTSFTDHDPAGDPLKDTTTTLSYPAPGQPKPHAPTSTTTKTGNGPTVTTGFTYDQTGNTLTKPDAAGNTQTMTWTPDGNLESAKTGTGTSTYVYDTEGNRLLRRDPGSTTLYLGSTELTLNTIGNTVSGTRYYSTAGGPTIVRSSDGRLAYTAADHHNTGTTSVDAATLQVQRRATKPFGEERGAQPTPGSWLGEKGFVGGAQDKATGLTHLGAREYDPRLGTFLSVDPVIDPSDPQQLQGYLYANNSPLTFTDPDGLFWGSLKKAVSKAVNTVKDNYKAISNIGHTVLDVAGMIPVIGEIADVANGVWYAAEGDWKNAAMSFAAVVPVVGSAVTGARVAAKAAKYVSKATSRTSKATSAARRGTSWSAKAGPPPGKTKASGAKSGSSGGKSGGSKASGSKASGGKSGSSGKGSSGAGGRSANSGSRQAPGCKNNSFTPDTEVLMADGTRKPIDQVTNGDQVLASDPATGRIEAKDVTAVITGEGDKNLVEITVLPAGAAEQPAAAAPQVVTATDKHPFWLPEQKTWTEAEQLQPGQWLETSSGTKVQIGSIRRFTQQQRVRNLTVSDLHTYYVLAGDSPLLVHNCNVGLGYQKAKAKEWANNEGLTHFMDLRFIDTWSTEVKKAIDNPNTTIHVFTEQFEGGFEGMATRGLAGGSGVHATAQEMSWLARAVIGERRSWDSIQFYDKSGKIDVPEPLWHESKWYTAWTLEWA
ncbi:RHS repeat-associated core domain-containing protein [Kitasatospora albolonga]|uniref:RHS repeat-associated core domain-containing protein n=1 Tax=Kitasatospora albolonga TaxID=68173 RepID=UPI0035EE0ACC